MGLFEDCRKLGHARKIIEMKARALQKNGDLRERAPFAS